MLFSNPGHPFSCGVTLAKLAAVTMDEQGNETFDASGALDRLRKVSSIFGVGLHKNRQALDIGCSFLHLKYVMEVQQGMSAHTIVWKLFNGTFAFELNVLTKFLIGNA